MKMNKILALALVLCLLTGLMSMSVLAADPPAAPPDAATGAVPADGSATPDGTPPDMPADGAAPDGVGGAPPDMPTGGSSSSALDSKDSSAYFSDLGADTAWANAYIDALYEKGIIDGIGDGRFNPGGTMKRCDFVVMLHKNYSFTGEGFAYNDVPSNAYYYEAVMRAKKLGILDEGTNFDPASGVTREEAALWMYRTEILNGMPADMSTSDVSAYGDAASISEECKQAVATLSTFGVLEGDDEGNFNPKATLTRAEMAVIFYRLASLAGGGGGDPGGMGGSGTGDATGGTGAYHYFDADAEFDGATLETDVVDENVLRAQGGVKVSVANSTLNKNGGDCTDADASGFYGLNAIVLATDDAQVTIKDSELYSNAKGSNGVFAYGENAVINIENTTIRTNQSGSRGLDATYGGTVNAKNMDIETQGQQSASIASDRGGAHMNVDGGKYVTTVMSSPVIYCTGTFDIKNISGNAKGAQMIVIEGKNSVTISDSTLEGNSEGRDPYGLFIYQSFSGDSEVGTSELHATKTKFTTHIGEMVHVTNTSCVVYFSECEFTYADPVFIVLAGNDGSMGWGTAGKNGGICELTADKQAVDGEVKVDSISELKMSLVNSSTFTGFTDADNVAKVCQLSLDATSKWVLTADSYVTGLTNADTACKNIESAGFNVYYDKDDAANAWLAGKTIDLAGGGKLMPAA